MADRGEVVTINNLHIGAQVRRGPDWSWEDQDGGIGGMGRIIALDRCHFWCRVRWANRHENSYRIGDIDDDEDGKGECPRYDLEYVERPTISARKRSQAELLAKQQERLWKQRKFTDAEVVVGTSRFPTKKDLTLS